MKNNLPNGVKLTNSITRAQTVESLIKNLSHKDRAVRHNATVALGKAGDVRAAGPLVRLLSRELTRSAASYPLIIDILDVIVMMPDRDVLDALMKAESQMVDRISPRCPKDLPAGVITYSDPVDGIIYRAVPRELHFKVLDAIRQMGSQLDYRTESIGERYRAYQQEVIMNEVDRVMPGMAEIFQEYDGVKARPFSESTMDGDSPSDEAIADIDYNVLRKEMEQEVAGYLKDNEKLMTLIRDGQRIKAHIQITKAEKLNTLAGRVSAR